MVDIRASAEKYESCRSNAGNREDRMKRDTWKMLYAFLPFRRKAGRQKHILRKGKIAAAALVMANTAIFRPGIGDQLACIVYSFDPYYMDDPSKIAELASKVYALKDMKKPPKGAKWIAHALKTETVQTFRQELDHGLFGEHTAYYTTVAISRSHIPGNILFDNVFPVIAAEKGKPDVMLLPCKYWVYPEEK